MNKKTVARQAESHLQVLCSEIGERRVGSEANRKATAYAESVLKQSGWQTETTRLSVIDWHTYGASLTSRDESFEVFSSHYALGCSVEGELITISSIENLEQTSIRDKIVLLHGPIASEQIAPKNFPFWNPDEHQHLIALLEKGCPKALICATERNAAVAGGVYPFPLFEDGDFDIPSVFMKDTEGVRLQEEVGLTVTLESKAGRIPETAFNLVARRMEKPVSAEEGIPMEKPVSTEEGIPMEKQIMSSKPDNNSSEKKRIVITAHIDTKIGTPGAIDNGTGVTVLLLLADLLHKSSSRYPIELVVFNGEDYYSAPGQVKYIEQNEGGFGDILLNINIDGAGYNVGPSCFSPFGLTDEMQSALQEVIASTPEIVEGLPWYQGDHSVFLQQGCAAIAVSSQWFIEHMESQEITHTPKDNLGIVDYERVAECAIGIAEFISKI